jgi:hypothetical protein
MPEKADNAHEVIWGPRRTRIRDDLRKFLGDAKISAKRFTMLLANEPEFGVKTSESGIVRFLDPAKPTLSDTVVLAIERYLDKYVRPEWEKAEWQPPQRGDPLFEAARTFFGMGRYKVRQYIDVVAGTYRFYTYSEAGKGRVCYGAFRLDSDFRVADRQTSIPPGETKEVTEDYEGFLVFRGDTANVLLRNVDVKNHRPKFYVLSISQFPDRVTGKRNSMSGMLLKSGGKTDLFCTPIHMIRDEDETAFCHTTIVPWDTVDPHILKVLDSGQWGPGGAVDADPAP